jgi:ubiquinone/menaquinone biosynthesis C-methylase UbiE
MASDHKQKSRAAFDRQARDYDTKPYGRHARRLHADVMAAVETFSFEDVLDVGCGTGATLAAIVAAHPDVTAWGIDLSPVMVGIARERLGDGADVQVADAEHLPLPDGSVDLVTCVDSLHHYPDPGAALAEMHRITRPRGGLVLGEWRVAAPLRQLLNWLLPRMPEGDVRVYTAAELTRLAEAAGYRVDRCAHAGVRGQLLVACRIGPEPGPLAGSASMR